MEYIVPSLIASQIYLVSHGFDLEAAETYLFCRKLKYSSFVYVLEILDSVEVSDFAFCANMACRNTEVLVREMAWKERFDKDLTHGW